MANGRLYQQHIFTGALDRPAPSIDRVDGADNIDTGSEPFPNEGLRDPASFIFISRHREDDPEIARHSSHESLISPERTLPAPSQQAKLSEHLSGQRTRKRAPLSETPQLFG